MLDFISTLEIGTSNQRLVISKGNIILSLDKEDMEDNVAYASLKGPRFEEILAAFDDTIEDVLLERIEFTDELYICFTKQPEGIVDEISLFFYISVCKFLHWSNKQGYQFLFLFFPYFNNRM